MIRPWVAAAALALALLGCQPELDVKLASEGERTPSPRFVVTERDRPAERPRYHAVQLLGEDGEVLWHVRAEPFGDAARTSTLTYGEKLSGFTSVVPPAVLQPNERYALVVHGLGRGGLRFLVDASGRLRALE